MNYNNKRLIGILLAVGALQWFFSVMIAEGLHKGYNLTTSNWIPYSNQIHYVSELGLGPTALIFNITTIILGITVIGGSYFLYLKDKSLLFSSLLLITGIGAIGVGVFPTDIQPTHGIFQSLALIFGAISAIFSYRKQTIPQSIISIALGLLSLISVIVFFPYLGLGANDVSTFLGLGKGILERIVIYSLILWIFSYGYYLLGNQD